MTSKISSTLDRFSFESPSMRRSGFVLLLSFLTASCSTARISDYSTPTGVPTAKLMPAFSGGSNRNTSVGLGIIVSTTNGREYRKLYDKKASNSKDPTLIVEANKEVILVYHETLLGNMYCRMEFNVAFEPDRVYFVTGGYESSSLFSQEQGGCKFAIRDMTTGGFLPLKRAR